MAPVSNVKKYAGRSEKRAKTVEPEARKFNYLTEPFKLEVPRGRNPAADKDKLPRLIDRLYRLPKRYGEIKQMSQILNEK